MMNFIKLVILTFAPLFLTCCLNVKNDIVLSESDTGSINKGSINIGINVNRFLVEFGAFFRGKSYKNYVLDLEKSINFEYLDNKFSLHNANKQQSLIFNDFKNDFLSNKENVSLRYNFQSESGLEDALRIFGDRAKFTYSKESDIVYISIDLQNFYYSIMDISHSSPALLNFSTINFNFIFPFDIEYVDKLESTNKQSETLMFGRIKPNIMSKKNVLTVSANIFKFSKEIGVLTLKVKLIKQ